MIIDQCKNQTLCLDAWKNKTGIDKKLISLLIYDYFNKPLVSTTSLITIMSSSNMN